MENGQNEKEKTLKEPRLNNMQRKSLMELVNARYQSLIDDARKKNQYAQDSAVEVVRRKLGYHLLTKRIDQLEQEQDDLRRKITDLGFDSDGSLKTAWSKEANGFVPIASDAKRLIEGTVADDAKKLEKERDEIVAKILLAETSKEARELVKV